jgi:hypothetical protein
MILARRSSRVVCSALPPRLRRAFSSLSVRNASKGTIWSWRNQGLLVRQNQWGALPASARLMCPRVKNDGSGHQRRKKRTCTSPCWRDSSARYVSALIILYLAFHSCLFILSLCLDSKSKAQGESTPLKVVVFMGSARNSPAAWGGPARLGSRVLKFVTNTLESPPEAVDSKFQVLSVLDPAELQWYVCVYIYMCL